MKTYSPAGLMGISDFLTPLTEGKGAQVHLYHHVSISDTVLTVVAAGLGFFLLSSVLKYKGARRK